MSRFILFVIFSLITISAHAGNLERLHSHKCDFKFSGPIAAGDADKIDAAIKPGAATMTLCLNSTGGSINEGVKMFQVIWDKSINTTILSGKNCLSACAIAFMGGSNVQGTDFTRQIERIIFPGARLGFHGPSLNLPSGKSYSSEAIGKSFKLALQVAAKLFKVQQTQAKGGTTLSSFLYGKFLSTSPEDMYYIETVGDAILANVWPAALAPEYPTNSDFAVNACRNYYVTHLPEKTTTFKLASTSNEHFNNLASAYKWEYAKVTTKFQSDGSSVSWVGPFSVGTKYHNGWCRVTLTAKTNFKPPSKFYLESPADTFHSNEGIKVGLAYLRSLDINEVMEHKDFEENPVPQWYIYDQKTELKSIPVNPNFQPFEPQVSSLGKDATNLLPSDLSEKFYTSVGLDLEGDDIGSSRSASVAECAQACSKTEGCSAATFDRWNNYCFLKTYVRGIKSNSRADSLIERSFLHMSETPRTLQERKFGMLQGKGFPDAPMQSFSNMDAKSCSAQCLENRQCIAFQLHNRVCDLFDRPSVYVSRSGYSAGILTQAPSAPAPKSAPPAQKPAPAVSAESRTDKGQCTVFAGAKIIDAEACTRIVEKTRNAAGQIQTIIYFVWPSGGKTVLVARNGEIALNGNITSMSPHPQGAAGMCAHNPKSGNKFCYFPGG